jgi:peptide-methionine (S)-S-oxide reductase
MEELAREGFWPAPVVTELVPLGVFYEAEEYHRDYYRRNPTQGYCQAVIVPKLQKLRAKYARKLKSSPESEDRSRASE